MTEDRADGYATAILEIAQAEDELDRLSSELFQVARALESSTELSETLSDRRIPIERRQAVVEDLIEGRASPLVLSVVSFLVSAERARELPAIVDQFVAKAAARRAKAVAEVRSAIPLDKEIVTRLENALSEATSKQVEVKVVVDPQVVGGISARVGDVVIDGSLRRRLDSLRQALRPA